MTGRRDYVVPVQLDDARPEDLPEDVVYVPVSRGSEAICAGLVEKLNRG